MPTRCVFNTCGALALYIYTLFCFVLFCFWQGEEFAAITPKRLQIPAVTAASVVKSKIIRDMDKKPSTAVSSQ